MSGAIQKDFRFPIEATEPSASGVGCSSTSGCEEKEDDARNRGEDSTIDSSFPVRNSSTFLKFDEGRPKIGDPYP